MPSLAQATTPSVGRTEGDMAKGSPNVMVLGEGSVSVLLTPFIVGGSVPAGTSRRGGLAVTRTNGEPSWALMSVGSDLPVWSEPLL